MHNGLDCVWLGENSWVNRKKGFKLIHTELEAVAVAEAEDDDWHAKCQTDLWERTDLEQETPS